MLASLFLFSFCACGSKKGGSKSDSTTSEKATTTAEKETTAEVVTAEVEIKTNTANEEGIDYWFGRNGKKYDKTKALASFTEASKNGCADAYYWMGIVTERDDDFERWDKVKAYMETAKEKGSDYGILGVAWGYYYGKPYERDYAKVKELAEESIKNEGLCGYLLLGLLYKNGYGVSTDPQKAIENFEKLTASDDWYLRNYALQNMGTMYEYGVDTGDESTSLPVDFEKAKSYFEQCLKDDYKSAGVQMASLYDDDQKLGNDPKKAFEYTQIAAESGNYYTLGLAYLYGKGVTQDYAKAMELFQKDMEEGNRVAFDMYAIAWMYAKGYGVEQDNEEAIDWCEDCIDMAGWGDSSVVSNAKQMIEAHSK